MDARRNFPMYRMEDYFPPSPSHWPLSHVRSSMGSQDDSSDLDTFDVDWVGNRAILIPYHARTIRNLTGRTLEASLKGLKRKHSDLSQPSSDSASEPETRKTPDPQCALRKECPPSCEVQPSPSQIGHQDMGLTNTDTTQKVNLGGSRPTPDRLLSTDNMVVEPLDAPTPKPTPQKRNTPFAHDFEIQRETQKPKIETQNKAPVSCANVKTSTAAIAMSIEEVPSPPRTIPIPREKTPQSIHLVSPYQQPNEAPGSTYQSISTVIQPQYNTSSQQPPLSQSTVSPPILPSEQSDDDNDAMNDGFFGPSRPTKVKKLKPKYICKLCDTTFTRHFDLLRHNQKHQVETEEDLTPRTCPNCDSVLSRMDATKRHVDSLPESCNYLRRKQGLTPLPAMPEEHYAACRAQYNKLAQERKKPKGRKKANPAA